MKFYNSLNDDMFFCLPWDNAQHSSMAKGHKIIISDVIYGNDAHTLMQIHIAVKQSDRVVKLSELFRGRTSAERETLLAEFEGGLRQCVSRNVTFKENLLDNNLVKVWYYQPENSSLKNDSAASNLFFRIAVTTANICAPNSNGEKQILSDLRAYMSDFISQIILHV